VIVAAALGPAGAAEAGSTRSVPPVHPVVPRDASGHPLEPDDLPGPQLEVAQAAAKLDVPAVPAFRLPASAPQPLELEIELDGEARPPLRRVVDEATRNASVDHLNACNQAIAARRYDDAIAACAAATAAWDGNHLAWYAAASAHLANRAWVEARAAIEHAITLRPDLAMYQLYDGIARYEAERQQAREDQARTEHKLPEDIAIDPARLRLDAARDALVTAIRLAPGLWRAHYYLGRIYRDLDDVRHAAQQFTRTIQTHPGYRFGYIALIELYRRSDYLDQALAVALLGTTHVPASEAADLWFEAGMAYAARHADNPALDAFTRVIATRPDDAGAKLQRGQLYGRRGELDHARRDLEDVVASTRALPDERRLATQLLGQIAGSLREPGNVPEAGWGSRKLSQRPFYTWQDAARSRVP
jgi:tetratricopeptide (TPR) repeat protein